MKTILKVAVICAICAVMMSGCLTSDDTASTDGESTSIISNVIDSVTGDEPGDLPITLYVDLAQLHEDIDDPDIMRFVLSEDETVVVCCRYDARR